MAINRHRKYGRLFCSGQGTLEVVMMLPFMVLIAGALISVAYICWQGIRTQQAANLAARIEGQERVAGGRTPEEIVSNNGYNDGGDDPSRLTDQIAGQMASNPDALKGAGVQSAPGNDDVYQHYYSAVQSLFTPGEQKKLLIPRPINPGVNTDTLMVIRLITPWKIFGMNLFPASITMDATAYGGEDPRMYGLPRWGPANGSMFWQNSKVLHAGTNTDGSPNSD